MIYRTAALFAALLAPVVPAQDPVPPKITSLLPQNYTGEFLIEMDRLQDTVLWEEVERSLFAGALFHNFRREYGYRLRDLRSIRGATIIQQVQEVPVQRLVVEFRGRRPFALPPVGKQLTGRREALRIGDFPVVQEVDPLGFDESSSTGWVVPKVFVVPDPLRLVYGARNLIEPILRGKRRGGVPHPELLAFTAGQRPLAYFAVRVEPGASGPQDLLDKAWQTDQDPLTFLMLRLHVDAKTGQTVLSAAFRFRSGKHGPARMRAGLQRFVKQLQDDERAASIKPLLDGVEFRIDAPDLVARVDLGGPRMIRGMMQSLAALPFLLFRPQPGLPGAVKVEVIEQAEEVKPAVEKPAVEKAAVEKAARRAARPGQATGKASKSGPGKQPAAGAKRQPPGKSR